MCRGAEGKFINANKKQRLKKINRGANRAPLFH